MQLLSSAYKLRAVASKTGLGYFCILKGTSFVVRDCSSLRKSARQISASNVNSFLSLRLHRANQKWNKTYQRRIQKHISETFIFTLQWREEETYGTSLMMLHIILLSYLVFCFSFKRCICGMYSLSCPMCAFWTEDSKILSVVWMGPPNRACCIYLPLFSPVSSICLLQMFSSILTMHPICQWRKGNMTALFAQAHPGPFHPTLQDMHAMSPQVIQMGDLIQFVFENENSLIKQIKCIYIKTCSLSTCCKLFVLYSLLRYKLFKKLEYIYIKQTW